MPDASPWRALAYARLSPCRSRARFPPPSFIFSVYRSRARYLARSRRAYAPPEHLVKCFIARKKVDGKRTMVGRTRAARHRAAEIPKFRTRITRRPGIFRRHQDRRRVYSATVVVVDTLKRRSGFARFLPRIKIERKFARASQAKESQGDSRAE